MRLRIGGIDKLTADDAVFVFCMQAFRLGDGSLHARLSVGQYDFRAECDEQLAPLHTHRGRHGQNEFITLDGTHGGKPDARVAARGFNEQGVFVNLPLPFQALYNGEGGAVFHAARGIEILEFGEDFRAAAIFFL